MIATRVLRLVPLVCHFIEEIVRTAVHDGVTDDEKERPLQQHRSPVSGTSEICDVGHCCSRRYRLDHEHEISGPSIPFVSTWRGRQTICHACRTFAVSTVLHLETGLRFPIHTRLGIRVSLQPPSTPRAPLYLSRYSLKMIFKSPPCSRMLFQGFHLQCTEAPPELTDSTQLEGIEDIRPADVDEIKRWIEMGTTPAKVRAE